MFAAAAPLFVVRHDTASTGPLLRAQTPTDRRDFPFDTADGDDAPQWRAISQAEGLLQLGRPADAMAILAKLPATGLHASVAKRLGAWAAYADGRWEEVERATRDADDSSGELRLLRGAALLARGQPDAAASILRDIWWNTPASRWALAALRLLADERLATKARYAPKERRAVRQLLPPLGPQLALDDHARVDATLERLQHSARRGGLLVAEIEHALGARQLATEHFSAAVTSLRAALSTSPPRTLRRAIELRLAQAERGRGGYSEARRHFANAAGTRDDALADEARGLAAQMAIEHRRYDEAKRLFEEHLLGNPLGRGRAQALWGLGWVAFRTGDFRGARRFFRAVIEESPFGNHAPGAIYWAARSAEELGHVVQAHDELRALCARFAHDAYCYQAERRIRDVAHAGSANAAALPRERQPTRLQRAASLIEAGMPKRASGELDAMTTEIDSLGPDSLSQIVQLAEAIHNERGARQASNTLALRFGVGTETLVESLFPRDELPLVDAASRLARLDPALLAASVSAISAFDPRSVSDTGAVGLMHLAPSTALALWREEHRRAALGRAELTDRAVNLRLGARYLGRTLRSFGGRVTYALAAYDAGPGAVTRWREARGDLPEEIFVEEIPYPKTKRFVLHVLSRLQIYRRAGRALADGPMAALH